MSNFNRESLRGYEGRIIVGAEVINGTGKVEFQFYQDEELAYGESVFFQMSASEALDFARLISQQAHEAMRAKWNEDNIV